MPFSQQSEAPFTPDESLLRIIEAIIAASRQNAAEQHGGAASETSNAPLLEPAGVELRTGVPGGAAQLQDAARAENPPAIYWTNDSSAGSRLLLPLLVLLQAAGARDTMSNGAMIDPNNSSGEPWSRPLPEHGGGVPPHDNLQEGGEQVPGWSDAGGGSPLRTALLNALLFLDRLRATTATTPTAPPYLLPAAQNMSPDVGSQSSNCVVLENFLQHVMRAENQQQQDCDSTGTQFLASLPLLLQAVAMYCGASSTNIDPASAGGGSSGSGRSDPNMVWLESEPPSSSPCWSSSVPEQRPRGASHDSNYAVVPHEEVLGLSDTGTLRTVLDDLLSHVRAAAADAAATTYLRSALNAAAGGDPGSSSSTTTTSTSGAAAAPAAQSHDDERAESPDWNAIRLQQLLLPLLMKMTGGAGINLNDVAREIMMMSNRGAAAVASAEYEEDLSREDCPMWRLVGLAPPYHPVLVQHLEHGPGGGALQGRYAIVPHAGIEHAGIPLTASNNRSSSGAPPPVLAAVAAASTPPYLLPAQQDSSMAGEGGMTHTQDSHGGAGWNPTGISSVFLPLSLQGRAAAGIATTTWPRAAAGSSKNTPARASTAKADHTIGDDHSSLSGSCTTMLKTEHQEERSCVPDELGGAASQKTNAEATPLAAVTSSHGAAPYTGYTQDRNGRKSLVKPAKRLSAYNIFFSEERLRILAQLNGDKQDDDDPTSRSNSQPPNMANNLAALQEHRRNKCKRKPHHTIGFRELGMIISARWRKVTAAERAMYQEKAEQDRVRFSTEMEVYTQAQQEDLTCRQRELEESVDQRTKKRYFAD